MASLANKSIEELREMRREANDRIANSSGMRRSDSIRWLHRIEKEMMRRKKNV